MSRAIQVRLETGLRNAGPRKGDRRYLRYPVREYVVCPLFKPQAPFKPPFQALAIGRLVIGSLRIGKLKVGDLEVDTLRVRKLEVTETQLP